MRLIDADALMKVYAPYEFMSDMGDAMEILANFPTVDAIPIEWIEETMRLAESVGAKEYAEHLEVLLADWAERKEE